MAEGSFNLTTWYAKRIIGDNAANTAANALLQIGDGVLNDTWILNKTGRSTNYGIVYNYDYDTTRTAGQEEGSADRIDLYGAGNCTAWVQLDTGNIYTSGYVGINSTPTTDARLYVNGITQITDNIYRAYSSSDSNGSPLLWMNSGNYDNYLWRISGGTSSKQSYGYSLKYFGTGTGVANYLKLIADNQNGTEVTAICINQSGQIGINGDASTSYNFNVTGTGCFTDTLRVNQIIITSKDPIAHLQFSRDGNNPYNYIVLPADVSGKPKTMLSIGNGASTSNSYLQITSESTKVVPNTATISASTGALIVNGGIGVALDIYIGGKVYRAGTSANWNKGRDKAIFVMDSVSAYSPWGSIKTKTGTSAAGSWEIGSYDSANFSEQLLFTYVDDTTYAGSTATYNQQIKFLNSGSIQAGKTPSQSSGTNTSYTSGTPAVTNGVNAPAGKIYLESESSNSGTRSLIVGNAKLVEADAFVFNQDNEISEMTSINTDMRFRIGGALTRSGELTANENRYIYFNDNTKSSNAYTNNHVASINAQLNTDNSNRLILSAFNNLGVEKTFSLCAPSQADENTAEQSYITWDSGMVDNSIYPYTTATYDLGSSDLGWRKIYLRGTPANSHAIDGTEPFIEFSNSDRTQYAQLMYSHIDGQGADQSLALIGNSGSTKTWIKAGGFVSNAASKIKIDDDAEGVVITPDGTIHLSETNAAGSERGGYIGFHYQGSTSVTHSIGAYADNVIGIHNFLGVNTDTKNHLLTGHIVNTAFRFSVDGGIWANGSIYSNSSIRIYNLDNGFMLYEGYNNGTTNGSQRYGHFYIDVYGEANTVGQTALSIGNNVDKTVAHNARGYIYLYGENTYNTTIIADTTNYTASRYFHLPDYNGVQYAVHAGSTAKVGDTTKPVYVDTNGRVTEITAGTTAQFYRGDKTWSSTLVGPLTLHRESTTEENKGAGIMFSTKDTTTNTTQSAGKTYIYAYNTHAADSDVGMNMVIRPGGNLFVGSGESAEALYATMKTSTTENLYLTADTTMYLEAGAGTIANRIGIAINSSGHILPQKAEATNNNAQNIGASDNKFANVYATTFTGALSGNASTASLLKCVSGTGSTAASSWGVVPSGSVKVWSQRFSDSSLKYTPEGGSATTITDTGDFVWWLTPSATSNSASLCMRIDGTFQASGFIGNASSATKLATARAINGTNFDGTGAITTSKWGTARNITIKDSDSSHAGTAVSVDGSGAITLLLPSTIKATLNGSASKLGTSTVGSTSRGIYLNSGTATALDWYISTCTINGGNQANYPWHRFATCTTGTGQWVDRSVIVVFHARYNSGRYGAIKLCVRTNASGAAMSSSAVWLYRYGFAAGDVKISTTSNTTGTDTRFNAYIKCGTYPRTIAYILEGSNNGWSLLSSNEPNDTTSSDKKGGTEINASVGGSAATDGAHVNSANYLTDKTDGTATYLDYGRAGITAASGFTWIGVWDGYNLAPASKGAMAEAVDASHKWVRLGGDTMTSSLTLSGGGISVQAGSIWAGTNGNTAAERQVGVQSGAGQMYMWAAASTTGARGIWLPAHGSGGAKAVFSVDTNNAVTFNGKLNGNASSATTSSKVTIAAGAGSTLYPVALVGSYSASAQSIYVSQNVKASNTALYTSGTFQIGPDNQAYHWVMGGGGSYAWCDVRNASNTVLQNIVVYSTYMQFKEIRATAVKNAVWNDYAEYRLAETEEPGRVVIPYSDKVARLSNARLQAGGRIISDTYGNIVGQNDIAKTPVGLAGRVLAYPYRDKSEYNIGDAVCSAPNGTVDKMTRDEIMMYPDRILGIVNEIPDYEVWESTLTYEAGRGKVTQQVQVKGRIWIDIK